jgi:hypothetical protein
LSIRGGEAVMVNENELKFTDLQIDNFVMLMRLFKHDEIRKLAEMYPDKFYPIYFEACKKFKRKSIKLPD